MQRELDQVVVIKAKTFLFLIEITEKNDILCPDCCVILFFQRFQGKGNHILVIFRSFEQLLYLDHIPGHGKGHVPQGQASLFVNDLQHGVDVGIVQYQKASGIACGITVFLQHGYAEAVKGINVTRIVVPGQVVYALPHFIGGFVGEGDAQDVARQNAQFIYQKGKTVGEGPGFSRAGPRDDTDITFRSTYRFPLGRVEFLHQICVFVILCHLISLRNKCS